MRRLYTQEKPSRWLRLHLLRLHLLRQRHLQRLPHPRLYRQRLPHLPVQETR